MHRVRVWLCKDVAIVEDRIAVGQGNGCGSQGEVGMGIGRGELDGMGWDGNQALCRVGQGQSVPLPSSSKPRQMCRGDDAAAALNPMR